MAFDNGIEIKRKPKLPFETPKHMAVRRNGIHGLIEVRHVSRATLNRPPTTESGTNLARPEKRDRRKARMRLRKRRGWR